MAIDKTPKGIFYGFGFSTLFYSTARKEKISP
jgi:hypothetical protein